MSGFHYRKLKALIALILILVLHGNSANAQFEGKEELFITPKNYTVLFTPVSPGIDGKIDDAVWQKAPWTDYFRDIEGIKKPVPPPLNTRVKMLWNDTCLFIAAEIQEPHVWAYLKDHDAVVYHDNDFEVFIDPDNNTHQYYEMEMNAVNTIFDLFMSKPYRNGSGAMIAYDIAGLRSAVNIQGTLNNSADQDNGWTVEIAIPFHAVTIGNATRVPRDGDLWRIGFSRVEWDTEIKDGKYIKKKDQTGRDLPEHNWVWSPQGLINMHFPERWGYLQFSKKTSGEAPTAFVLPYSEKQKQYLWLVYYKQKDYYQKNGKYAASLADIGIAPDPGIEGQANKLSMEATTRQFMATIVNGTNAWSINDEGLIQARR
jgi:hypothetical protein